MDRFTRFLQQSSVDELVGLVEKLVAELTRRGVEITCSVEIGALDETESP